jgi:hypothetical protein
MGDSGLDFLAEPSMIKWGKRVLMDSNKISQTTSLQLFGKLSDHHESATKQEPDETLV